jgi:outer membrane protein insertion porin family
MPPLVARTVRGLLLVAWAFVTAAAPAQETGEGRDLTGLPVSEIRIVGLQRVAEQKVLNQLRTAVGSPFDPETVREDVARLHGLAEFRKIAANVEPRDGSVAVIYVLEEAPIIAAVQVVGNKAISDQEILAATNILEGVPRDDYLIENATRRIEAIYRERGYYLTTVTIDESELQETGILLFLVVEGPRVRIKEIDFRGNRAFSARQLQGEIETKKAFPILERGELDQERLAADVAALVRYYEDRGYIDVRVDRTVDLSPDSREAKVTFVIEEGRQYTLGSIGTDPDPLSVFSREQILALMAIRPGDVYSADRIRDSEKAIRDAYLLLGYVDMTEPRSIEMIPLHSGEQAEVTLLVRIDESRPYKVGLVRITGNFLTRDRVIRRHLRGLRPGRTFDGRAIDRARDALRASRLFSQVEIAVQDPDPASPDYRDVVVEVSEANTGSVNFGVAAGSDAGLFGEFSITQRNFALDDWPASFGELVTGRAFRGGGQVFNMTLRPGSELFQYSLGWTEPFLFETPNSLRVAASYTDREYSSSGDDLYDETRLALPISLGRRLGEIWDGAITASFQRIELDDISADAPVDYFEAAGPDNLTSLGVELVRSTVKTFVRPGEGSRLALRFDQAGALGGDYTFSRVEADYSVFLTPYRDFLGRRHTLKLEARMGWIFAGDAPVYERFYLGGRSLRGFEYRTVSPKGFTLTGQQTIDPVGGDWLLFLGAQYEIPLIGESLGLVAFVDSGTVTDNPGFGDYRLALGGGLRIYIPQLGPVPLAFDFATPLLQEDGDETELFSFSAELPFR